MALTDSLISYWKLDEVSGTRADEVGGNTLTDNNTVTSATGKIGLAAQFTAANVEYLSHASNAALTTGDIDFSVSLWVNLAATATYYVAISKGQQATEYEYFLVWDPVDNRMRFTVSSNGTATTNREAFNFGALAINTWYHIVIWHDSVNNLLGISVNDSTAETTSYSSGVFSAAGAFQIGSFGMPGVQLPWGGLIDEAGFWKRVLTSLERTALYNGGAGLPFSSFSPVAATGNRSNLMLLGVG